ncbi:MAG: metalloregulator ArsR/SmtB family transcription factor [Bacteroidetes bacterium]|nr:metalloregulator ArsR/SmtB family transcription factor [Bacteroidota bacterium]
MRRDPFQAIADPNRRAILALIARESMNLNTVASHFSVSRPAISKHIKILRQCGLVEIRQKGRERYCEARLERLSEVVLWLEDYRSQWGTEIHTEPIAVAAEKPDVTAAPVAEVSVADTEPAAVRLTSETAAAEEIGETLTEIQEVTVVDPADEAAVPASDPQMEFIATKEVDLTVDREASRVTAASVPWEEGYDEAKDITDDHMEVDLSADAVTDSQAATVVEETQVTVPIEETLSEPESEPDVKTPVRPVAKSTTRKKKSAPPTDTQQGSLF